MCWSSRIYFSFDPGWWRGCCPVSRAIFTLTPLSAACNVPTCNCFHGRGCIFARDLQILLQPLFCVLNLLPKIMSQFRGVCNRYARTSKTFPYSPKSLPLSYWICFFPQLGNHFRTQRELNAEALPRLMMMKWEFGIYKGYKFRIVSAIPLFVITKGEIWDVAKHIQISCHLRSQ